MSRKKRIDQAADEADRLPLFAAEIRGEGEAERLPLFADEVHGGKGGEETDSLVKGETPAPEPERAEADTLSSHFANLFNQGRSFSSIIEARKVASEFFGKEIKPETVEAKQADEAIELGVVLAPRKIVEENRDNPEATYDGLLDLYNRQPNLNVRTSTSVANQAYSTPVPSIRATISK